MTSGAQTCCMLKYIAFVFIGFFATSDLELLTTMSSRNILKFPTIFVSEIYCMLTSSSENLTSSSEKTENSLPDLFQKIYCILTSSSENLTSSSEKI